MVTLVATLHDPEDRQLEQGLRVLPALRQIYEGIVVVASSATTRRSLTELRQGGAQVELQHEDPATLGTLGSVRLQSLVAGLRTGSSHLHLCDWDRVIHWAETYREELEEVIQAIVHDDFLILGRTIRAFNTHPRVQRDTEAIINHCFGLVWGEALDITAASRGVSRRAAEALVAGCDEPSLGNDGVWPLFLRHQPEMSIGYRATEGLEWETPDRYRDEIAAAGGLQRWIAQFDAEPARWVDRLLLAQIEVEAIHRWQLRFQQESVKKQIITPPLYYNRSHDP